MTPCEKLGYKVGDKFEVVADSCGFKAGQVVTLARDDESRAPCFSGKNAAYQNAPGRAEGAYIGLDNVKPLTTQKLRPAKQFLADAIHASGNGWPDGADFAVQDKDMWVCLYEGKPTRHGDKWSDDGDCLYKFGFSHKKLSPNWHQTVLSREEYFSAYPAEPVADADGWIEWNGGECPVERGTLVDVKYSGGEENFGVSALTEGWHDDHVRGSNDNRTAVNWVDILPVSGIVSYRLHKPEVNHEFCESVTHSIPEPETKPTIEQLAQDYRNKLDFANRKRQEADDARAAADAALGELVKAGEELGLVIGIATPEP